uniref:Uncharacterized protein n=1 Tax=Anguilla anguilla TaxID=7936 RepID=A0A0E9PZI8_ANGAN
MGRRYIASLNNAEAQTHHSQPPRLLFHQRLHQAEHYYTKGLTAMLP